MLRGCVLAAMAAWSVAVCGAQQQAAVPALHPVTPMPAYEVATIKPAARMTPLGMTASRYVQWAFGLPRISGVVLNGPEWMEKDQFDIQGKPAESDRAAMEKMSRGDKDKMRRRMGQSLLAERFHLKMHFETRAMPVYELVVDKGGPRMVKNTSDGAGDGDLNAAGSQKGIHILAKNVSMDLFCSALQSFAIDRPVVDKTGLTGQRFDFEMRFASDGRQFGGVVAASDPDNGSPSLFTALRELGLRLEPAKDPVEVVVIDHIEMPTEN